MAVHVMAGPVSFSLQWQNRKFVFSSDTFPNKWFIEHDRDADIGIHETVLGAGNLVGPLAGGLIGEYIGARAPYLLGAGVIAIALLAQAVYLRRVRITT